jgi:ADP-ribose pyrophosphatase YjhB (NUDIX family)
MHIVYATQEPPEVVTKSVFLVGPTPRSETGGESWRPAMIDALREAGYDGVVYVPETEDGKWKHSYLDQIAWEQKYLHQCDCLVAWIPRELQKMPAFTTNVEFGEFVHSGKMVYGRPMQAPKTRYLDVLYEEATGSKPWESIQAVAEVAVRRIGSGAPRRGGQRAVPLDIWRSKQFQAWHDELVHAGNRLDDAKALWSFYVGPTKSFLFSFALHVNVWVEAEQRHKSNEYIFSRTDISAIVPYYLGLDPNDPQIVLVKEYRSPSRTKDGFVHELPGGSSFKTDRVPTQVASEEMKEETGLEIEPRRFRLVNTRQIGATLSTHRSYVFAVELTDDEYEQAVALEKSGTSLGVVEDTEITYVECRSLSDILAERLVDWSNVGMILETLHRVDHPEIAE